MSRENSFNVKDLKKFPCVCKSSPAPYLPEITMGMAEILSLVVILV